MKLEGTLRQFSLREIMEMMVDSSVTGALEVVSASGTGLVYTHMGDLYHATFNDQIGPAAIWHMFELQDGNFHFIAGERTEQRTLLEDLSTLVTEAEERARAWAPIRPRIGTLRLIPIFEPGTDHDHIHINEEDWPVLAAIDGQRSIAEVAEHIQSDPLDVARALIRLIDRGLVRLTQAAQAPQRTGLLKTAGNLRPGQPQPQQADSGSSGGLLARTLAVISQQAQLPVERRDHITSRPATEAVPAVHPHAVQPAPEDEILRILRGG